MKVLELYSGIGGMHYALRGMYKYKYFKYILRLEKFKN